MEKAQINRYVWKENTLPLRPLWIYNYTKKAIEK